VNSWPQFWAVQTVIWSTAALTALAIYWLETLGDLG